MRPIAVEPSNTVERAGMSLSLEGVTTYLRFGRELKSVILRVDLRIEPGEIVGLVGESGSGKSMTARTIAGVLPRGAITEGALLLGGEDLLQMPHRRRRHVQAKEIGVIFQDPRAYIDPLWRVEVHMTEAMRVHLGLSRSEARTRAIRASRFGGHRPAGTSDATVPRRALGRNAPKSDDRRGSRRGPLCPSRRRGHDRPRRHDPGGDRQAARGPQLADAGSRCSSSPTTWPWPTLYAAGSA